MHVRRPAKPAASTAASSVKYDAIAGSSCAAVELSSIDASSSGGSPHKPADDRKMNERAPAFSAASAARATATPAGTSGSGGTEQTTPGIDAPRVARPAPRGLVPPDRCPPP